MKRLSTIDVPQKEDLDLVLVLPDMVASGHNTSGRIASRIHQNVRQASFLLHAGRLLGLVRRRGQTHELTGTGRLFQELEQDDRRHFLRSLVLRSKVIRYLFRVAEDENLGRLNRTYIAQILVADSELSNTTARRRASTLCAWLKWLSQFPSVKRISMGEYEVRLG